jgi:endonuclease-8
VPEGDAVYRAARRLRALDGEVVTTSDFRVPQHSTADLVGATVATTVSRGKHLLTRFEPADGSPGVTLHTHLKMEGAWHLHAPGTAWRRPAREARVVLRTADREAVGFALGVVALVPTAEEETVVGHLGPDLLGPDWDEDEAVRRMTTGPDRSVGEDPEVSTLRPSGGTIGEALLDQRNLSGIGTIYRAETLFLTGVSPFLPVPEVPDLHKVVSLARRLLLANRDRPQITTTGDTRRGQRLWVYGRGGRPCLRCGTTIRRAMLGPPPYDRVAYWCPSCQAPPT